MSDDDEYLNAVRRLRDALAMLGVRPDGGGHAPAAKRPQDLDHETRAIVDLALGGWTVVWRYSDDDLEEVVGIEAWRESTVRVHPSPCPGSDAIAGGGGDRR